MKNILVTGGCGFIGNNFIRRLFEHYKFDGVVVNIDRLTYPNSIIGLQDIAQQYPDQYHFVHGNITDFNLITSLLQDYKIDTIINFAAESHVDKSLYNLSPFIDSNIVGTITLLDAIRKVDINIRFHQVSTDECWGSLGAIGYFNESSPYKPRNPYAASKASADLFVQAYYHTYNCAVTVSNCSNNYGPYQFPEKLIPLVILRILQQQEIPIYGTGTNIREWIYVNDHCDAIWKIVNDGKIGLSYAIGGGYEIDNISLVNRIIAIMAKFGYTTIEKATSLITFISDRLGHDFRYAVSRKQMLYNFSWEPQVSFSQGLADTIKWYVEHQEWCQKVMSSEYEEWIKLNYMNRGNAHVENHSSK